MNDVIINKIQSIQRCIVRAKEEYDQASDFTTDYSRQDAAILNITRACEQAIDLANVVIKTHQLGIPVNSANSFELLARQHIITPVLADSLRRMVGFRNIAVHQYQDLNIVIVKAVIEKELDELVTYTRKIALYNNQS